jgi:hypothetical protein
VYPDTLPVGIDHAHARSSRSHVGDGPVIKAAADERGEDEAFVGLKETGHGDQVDRQVKMKEG